MDAGDPVHTVNVRGAQKRSMAQMQGGLDGTKVGRGTSHRKILSAQQILAKWPNEGFHIGTTGQLFCMCSKRPCGDNWDEAMVKRHIQGKTHQRVVKGKNVVATAHPLGGGYQSSQHKEWLRQHRQHQQQRQSAAVVTAAANALASVSSTGGPGQTAIMVPPPGAEAPIPNVPGHMIHLNRKWQRVAQYNPDGTEGRPYWFDAETGATAWVPPPPPPPSTADQEDKPAKKRVRNEDGTGPKRAHRKFIPPERIVEAWPGEGFFVGPNLELRCMCSRKICGPWDREMVNRHISGKAHTRMKSRIVKVPMPFYTCKIHLKDLAELAIAVSAATEDKPTWGERRRRRKKKPQEQHANPHNQPGPDGTGPGAEVDDSVGDASAATAAAAAVAAEAAAAGGGAGGGANDDLLASLEDPLDPTEAL